MPFQCSSDTFKYIYDQSSISGGAIQLSVNNTSVNDTMQIIKPSEGLQYSEATTVIIELTPISRISEMLISLEAPNAESVIFSTDNEQIMARNEVGNFYGNIEKKSTSFQIILLALNSISRQLYSTMIYMLVIWTRGCGGIG